MDFVRTGIGRVQMHDRRQTGFQQPRTDIVELDMAADQHEFVAAADRENLAFGRACVELFEVLDLTDL